MASIESRQGTRALVTRPRGEAEALAAALAARGLGALVEPMIEISFPAAAIDLTGVQAVLCTSANGVRALARASAERAVPLFAVGDATAARARAAGFADVASAGGDAADLARLAARRLSPQDGRLVHLCGSAVAGDLAGALRARGFAVERIELYEARPAAALSPAAVAALEGGEIGWALFFSPRTATIFTRLAEAAGVGQRCANVAALSISAAADRPLAELQWRERRIAARPEQAALLDLLDRILASRQQR